MRKHILAGLIIVLFCFGIAFADTFTSNVKLKKDGKSPNLEFFEGVGGNDTYSNIYWRDPNGRVMTFLGAHTIKGSTGEPHYHFMERFSCENKGANKGGCPRIETDIDSDHPVREFRDMDLFINDGKFFLESPDGNTWSLSVANDGSLLVVDENPAEQPER